VEAAVTGILVLRPALRAERESSHGRQRPVVGDAGHDREARPALRAVDERVQVAAVARVEELAQAVVARGDIRRDQRGAAMLFAEPDSELGLAERNARPGLD
jgi:hypothetical protein